MVEWHRLLLQLRNHYADPAVNPRERFSVGVAQDPNGPASGIAITSARQPLVDDLTVRQTGAIAYALSGLVDERIELRQKEVFDDLESWSKRIWTGSTRSTWRHPRPTTPLTVPDERRKPACPVTRSATWFVAQLGPSWSRRRVRYATSALLPAVRWAFPYAARASAERPSRRRRGERWRGRRGNRARSSLSTIASATSGPSSSARRDGPIQRDDR